MLQLLFHAWERRLAAVTTDRVVRPFEWGWDWTADFSAGLGDLESNYPTQAKERLPPQQANCRLAGGPGLEWATRPLPHVALPG